MRSVQTENGPHMLIHRKLSCWGVCCPSEWEDWSKPEASWPRGVGGGCWAAMFTPGLINNFSFSFTSLGPTHSPNHNFQ